MNQFKNTCDKSPISSSYVNKVTIETQGDIIKNFKFALDPDDLEELEISQSFKNGTVSEVKNVSTMETQKHVEELSNQLHMQIQSISQNISVSDNTILNYPPKLSIKTIEQNNLKDKTHLLRKILSDQEQSLKNNENFKTDIIMKFHKHFEEHINQKISHRCQERLNFDLSGKPILIVSIELDVLSLHSGVIFSKIDSMFLDSQKLITDNTYDHVKGKEENLIYNPCNYLKERQLKKKYITATNVKQLPSVDQIAMDTDSKIHEYNHMTLKHSTKKHDKEIKRAAVDDSVLEQNKKPKVPIEDVLGSCAVKMNNCILANSRLDKKIRNNIGEKKPYNITNIEEMGEPIGMPNRSIERNLKKKSAKTEKNQFSLKFDFLDE